MARSKRKEFAVSTVFPAYVEAIEPRDATIGALSCIVYKASHWEMGSTSSREGST
jgi:hypothetical protein